MTEYEIHGDFADSPLYMGLRREINEKYAEHPVDFNAEGLKAGELVLGRMLSSGDIIADIGSNSGVMIAEASRATSIRPKIVCIEPDKEAFNSHLLLDAEQKKQLHFIQAVGENIPLRDNSVRGASLHNVIFRARNAKVMLQEVQRIVEPGGFIVISSNARGHAMYRHSFERYVAETVMRRSGVSFTIPLPPAEGHYLENLPDLIDQVEGLTNIDELYVAQDTQAIITPGERLDAYLDSIKFSAANTDLPHELRWMWRKVVDKEVRPFIKVKAALNSIEHGYTGSDNVSTPYFSDPIHRGMFVLQSQ